MKKVIGAASGVISSLLMATSAFATSHDIVKVETCPPTGTTFFDICKLSTGSFGDLIGKVINFIFVIATVVALFYLIYGGLKWIMSEGDKSAVETARNHIVSAIIGLIVIFLAYFIINIVLGFFTGVGLQDLTLPRLPK